MGLFGFFKRAGKPDVEVSSAVLAEIETCVRDLNDGAWETRLKACETLGSHGPVARAATPKLQQMIDDDNGDVCLAAAAALSKIEREL